MDWHPPAPASEVASAATRDALVVGGGLAGSALALSLAQAGRSVVLIEKSAAAHPKVCGEFLSHEALHYLDKLSIDAEALGAVPIELVRLVRGRVTACCRLPFRALSLSRECLDEALLTRARAAGAEVLRGRRVQSLKRTDAGWAAQLPDGETITGRTAFLTTGKHDLHGWNRPPGRQNDLIAFKMNWRLSAPQHAALERHVELVLFPGGYAGLQLVEQGRANLCLLVSREAFRSSGGSWTALLDHMLAHSPHLATRLAGATPLWAAPLSLSGIPYGHVRTPPAIASAAPEPWRLGDQAAVIPSFAGDGMSIALHSARLAASIYCGGGDADSFQRRLAREVAHQVALATLVSRLLIGMPAVVGVAARLWPGLLASIGNSTRIRSNHLLNARR